ncbi:MAG: DUF4290 domain-containing protein [Flavobacteriales bacterium]
MEYNTQRPKLIISEYGRHVQKMVDQALAMSDRDERNKYAQYIISVMGQLNPHLRDIEDFKHKLWDHLFIMSDFRLDVDSPYPIPSREVLNTKPDRVNYPSNEIKLRHYGKIIERIIDKTVKMEAGEQKNLMIGAVGNHLKKSFLAWNRDSVEDEQIASDLIQISGGQLRLNEDTKLNSIKDLIIPSQNQNQQRNKRNAKKKKRKFTGGSY